MSNDLLGAIVQTDEATHPVPTDFHKFCLLADVDDGLNM